VCGSRLAADLEAAAEYESNIVQCRVFGDPTVSDLSNIGENVTPTFSRGDFRLGTQSEPIVGGLNDFRGFTCSVPPGAFDA
jgi:hypothetical protein